MIESQQQKKNCLRNFFRLCGRETVNNEKKFVREMTSDPDSPRPARAGHPSLRGERGKCECLIPFYT